MFFYFVCTIVDGMELAGVFVQTILALTIVIDTGLFLFVFQKRKQGIIFVLLLIHLAGILVWCFSILMLLLHTSIFWAQCAFAAPVVLAIAKFLFVMGFPENNLPKKSLQYLLMIPIVVLIPFSFIEGIFFTDVAVVGGFYITAENGPYAFVYSLCISYLLIYPIFLLAQKYRHTVQNSHHKEQLKYLLYGTAFFFIVGLVANSILPVFFGIYFFNGLGPSFSLILASFMVHIISRHNFLDFRKALQRSFIYSVLLFLVVGSYIGILNVIGLFVQHVSESAIVISAGLTSIVGVFTFPIIEKFLRKKTNTFFFKDHYNYGDALYTLSEHINEIVHVEDIKKMSERTLQQIFKSEIVTSSIGIEHTVTKDDVVVQNDDMGTLTIPVIREGVCIGTIFLGEKKSGDVYTHEDVVLMRTFAHHIAVAFEKARLFKEVQTYSQELEVRVQQRTKQIEELKESETHMMLDISHKLQNSLTIIKNEIHLLRGSVGNTDSLAFFEKTIDDTSTFIYDLLHLARLGSSQDIMVKEHIDFSAHMTELIEYIEVVTQHSGIECVGNISPGIMLYCSKEKMTELVTNLISNAVKYIGIHEHADAKITISLSKSKSGVDMVIVDNGIGICKEDVPHIFEQFYRTKSTARSNIAGTGLGLAICKKIVDAHNGSIMVESEEGRGTTFTVHFDECS